MFSSAEPYKSKAFFCISIHKLWLEPYSFIRSSSSVSSSVSPFLGFFFPLSIVFRVALSDAPLSSNVEHCLHFRYFRTGCVHTCVTRGSRCWHLRRVAVSLEHYCSQVLLSSSRLDLLLLLGAQNQYTSRHVHVVLLDSQLVQSLHSKAMLTGDDTFLPVRLLIITRQPGARRVRRAAPHLWQTTDAPLSRAPV